MQAAAVVPLAVLAAGIATALSVESLIQAEPAASSEPQLELEGLAALASGPAGAASFAAEASIIRSGTAYADDVSGTIANAGGEYDFRARRMEMGLAGKIVLSGDVSVSSKDRVIKAATVAFERDGTLYGSPADIRGNAEGDFAAGSFRISPDGTLQLSGGVAGSLKQ